MEDVSTGIGGKSSPDFEYLEEWARLKVQEFVQGLLEEEVEALLGRSRHERRRAVDSQGGYRNGYGKARRLSLRTGTIELRRPRVRGLEERFESRILPLFARRSKEVGELLPQLYLHGLAKGDFELALRGLLGDGAPLSPASIQRLKAKWQLEYDSWRNEDLSDLELVYLWTDGLYVKAGIGRDKAALLIVVGALRDGSKRILALESGVRESTASWADVLRSLRKRGLVAPRLVVADGHLGIWGAMSEIYPESAEQRCWNHKILNVLSQIPRRSWPQARELLSRIPYAETRAESERLKAEFKKFFGRTYPKAVETLESDWERMVTFYQFPKEHWLHIRTTNVIESPFAAIRLRTNAARRYRNVANATALIWKVMMVAEKRFRKLNAPHLLSQVYEGATFTDGREVKSTQREVAA